MNNENIRIELLNINKDNENKDNENKDNENKANENKDNENKDNENLIYILENIINNNKYVNKTISNKSKDINSLSYLIDYKLSQSDCIKLGISLEIIIKEFILNQSKEILDIKEMNKKDIIEKDHLFEDKKNKIIYYAELKSNLNLDTEKIKSTVSKCLKVKNELQEKYKEYEIKMSLLNLRYYSTNKIPTNIIKKFIHIKDNLIGVNEYFTLFKIKYNFKSECEYKKFLNIISKKMFNY